MSQCKSTFDVEGQGFGRTCYVSCSKQCYDRCLVGSYELPVEVGLCNSPQCKMMKRTILDIDGVFSHETRFSRPGSMFGGVFTSNVNETELASSDGEESVASAVLSSFPGKLDLSQIAGDVDLDPEAIEEVISGKSKKA